MIHLDSHEETRISPAIDDKVMGILDISAVEMLQFKRI